MAPPVGSGFHGLPRGPFATSMLVPGSISLEVYTLRDPRIMLGPSTRPAVLRGFTCFPFPTKRTLEGVIMDPKGGVDRKVYLVEVSSPGALPAVLAALKSLSVDEACQAEFG